jgi:hypothetical protein
VEPSQAAGRLPSGAGRLRHVARLRTPRFSFLTLEGSWRFCVTRRPGIGFADRKAVEGVHEALRSGVQPWIGPGTTLAGKVRTLA